MRARKQLGRWRPGIAAATLAGLTILATAQLLSMSLWFSGAAVLPASRSEWTSDESTAGWFTIAVQLGFVAGTLLSAFLNLPDVLSPSIWLQVVQYWAPRQRCLRLFCRRTAIGNRPALSDRNVPGGSLSSWNEDPGDVVSALARNGARGSCWRANAGQGVVLSDQWHRQRQLAHQHDLHFLAGGGGRSRHLWFVENGPFAFAMAPFDWRQVIEVFKNRGVRLASFGYFGHMWELYAMWIWAPVMIRASLGQGNQPALAEVASFLVIGCGAIGVSLPDCWLTALGAQ